MRNIGRKIFCVAFVVVGGDGPMTTCYAFRLPLDVCATGLEGRKIPYIHYVAFLVDGDGLLEASRTLKEKLE